MSLLTIHPDFPTSPYDIIDPSLRSYPPPPPLVREIRTQVKAWRDSGYRNATDTSVALLNWWFNTPERDFQYYFAQREAVETIIYLYDVLGIRNSRELVRFDRTGQLTDDDFKEHWNRLVVKMATGTGKTKVMSLAIAWSFFHKLYEPDSDLSRNFLVIAPNIIVLDRLYGDFRGLSIFHNDPVLPDNGYFDGRNWYTDFQPKLHRQDEVRTTFPTGNIFLTNIHRVYPNDQSPPSLNDSNTMDYFLLGKRPTGKTTDSKVDLGDIVRDIEELMILNDEAHHIHDTQLAWYKSIEDLHNRLLQRGGALSLQLDVSATPKHSNGAIFAQTVTDYPLLEAITQNVVKRPTVPDQSSRNRLVENPNLKYTEKFADYLNLGVTEWFKNSLEHEKTGKKAILFVMTDDTRNCDEVAVYLENHPELKGAVLVIHTKKNGEISEASSGKARKDLEKLRDQAKDIDSPDSPYKAIVSVLMLKEGWDVKNVTTIVGLRAYNSPARILAEQTIGRGLRLMYAGEASERVSVIGTDALMDFIKDELEKEGVTPDEVAMGEDEPFVGSVIIEVDRDNPAKDVDALDIEIPILCPRIWRGDADLTSLDVNDLDFQPTFYYEYSESDIQDTIDVVFRDLVTYDPTHVTTLNRNNRHFRTDFGDIIRDLAMGLMRECYISQYDVLYARLEEFVKYYLFGATVELDSPNTWRNLFEESTRMIIQECFKNAINDLALQERIPAEIDGYISLLSTRPFPVKDERYILPRKSLFNRITGDNNSQLELDFSHFLDSCPDVAAYAKNYKENPQARFRLDYVNYQGNIADYYPDFLVRLTDGRIVIVETKGQQFVDENVPLKKCRLAQWCHDVNEIVQSAIYHSVYVDYAGFQEFSATRQTFRELLASMGQVRQK